MESSKLLKNSIRFLLPPVFWLGVWQLAAFLVELSVDGKGNELLIPYPATVALALLELSWEFTFWQTVVTSLLRIVAGMAAGTFLGVMLAGLTCASTTANLLLSPAVQVIRATPVASFILLVLLWTDRGSVPAIIAGLMVLPVIWGNMVRGIRETDRKLLEMARAFRFSRGKTLRLIYIPSARPYFLSGVTTSMGLAWKSGVAAEALCLPGTAIGTQIYNTKYYLETPDLFAWTLTVILLSLALEKTLSAWLGRQNGGKTI